MTATTYPPYVGDIGYPVTLPMGTILGTVDLVVQEFHVIKPGSTTPVVWSATVADDTYITYDTASGDFSVRGDYLIQPYGEYSTGEKLYGPTTLLHVYDHGEFATTSVAPTASSQIYTTLKSYVDDTFLPIGSDVTHDQLTDLIIVGDTPPTVTPTFIGQRYVDKINNISYEAYGTSSSQDWKAMSLSPHNDTSHYGSAKRGGADGVAPLNGWGIVPSSNSNPFMQNWCVMDGLVPDWLVNMDFGGGFGSSEAATHSRVHTVPQDAPSHNSRSMRDSVTVSNNPLFMSYQVLPGDWAGPNHRESNYGLRASWDLSHDVSGKYCMFAHTYNAGVDRWVWLSSDGGAVGSGVISPAPVAGDILSIRITADYAWFFVNGTSVGTSSANLPTAPLYVGSGVRNYDLGDPGSYSEKVGYMSLSRYLIF